MEVILRRYHQWLEAGPLERLSIEVPEDGSYNRTRVRQRMDLRASSLLLTALPSNLKEELISTRQLAAGAIVFRERLRRWRRHQLRALELNVSLPDATLLIRSLTKTVGSVLSQSPQAAFRINSFRMTNKLDTQPTEESVLNYYTLLLSEMELLSLSPEDAGGSTVPAVKMMNSATKPGASPSGATLSAGRGAQKEVVVSAVIAPSSLMTGQVLMTKVLVAGSVREWDTKRQFVRSGAQRVVRWGGVVPQVWWRHPTRMEKDKREKGKQRILRRKEIKEKEESQVQIHHQRFRQLRRRRRSQLQRRRDLRMVTWPRTRTVRLRR